MDSTFTIQYALVRSFKRSRSPTGSLNMLDYYTHQNHKRKSTAFPRGQDGAFDSNIFCCSSALGNPAACRAGPARGCIVPANKACYKCVPWVHDAGCMVWREVGLWETASNAAAAANGRPFFLFRQPSGFNTPLRSCTCPAPLPSAHSIRVLLWIIMLGCV